jgi:hypothetical protein
MPNPRAPIHRPGIGGGGRHRHWGGWTVQKWTANMF